MDMLPGYKNPKTKEPCLWECPDQKCAKMSWEKLNEVFEESVEEKKTDKCHTYAEALKKDGYAKKKVEDTTILTKPVESIV
jgi:hypothetical protein